MIDGLSVGAASLAFLLSSNINICCSSKDALIRVWDRHTLELHTTFRGHEGPVNAVGLQSGRVVSASGDGKMMLWDIESGERMRVFEGHDRGLACIEFKVCIFIYHYVCCLLIFVIRMTSSYQALMTARLNSGLHLRATVSLLSWVTTSSSAPSLLNLEVGDSSAQAMIKQ